MSQIHIIRCGFWNGLKSTEAQKILSKITTEDIIMDNKYEHPVLMEIAHQAGMNNTIWDEKLIIEENQDRWNRMNKYFMLLWSNDKIYNCGL